MKTIYRGFELNAKRGRSLGGDTNLYYFVMRVCDGWMLDDAFTTGSETAKEFMPYLKKRVDDYYENPLNYLDAGSDTDTLIQEMLLSFTPSEIGEHFRKFAEAIKAQGAA